MYANIASLGAQHSLADTQGRLESAIQRLSTGLRINSPADDAAGYAIASRMTSQINGISRAVQNANDGISLIQVAGGALAQMVANFQQVRTLAVQATNPTYTLSDRQALQANVDQLISANLDISANTNYNGITLLDGSFIEQQLQVGANSDQTMAISIAPVFGQNGGTRIVQAPLQRASVSGQVSSALHQGDLTIDGIAIGASQAGAQAGQTAGSAWAIAQAINTANIQNLQASAASSIAANETGGAAISAGALVINGTGIGAIAGGNGSQRAASAAAAINAASGSSGVSASAAGASLTLSTADGGDINVSGAAAAQLGLGASFGTITLTTTIGTDASFISIGGNNPAAAGLTKSIIHSTDTGGTAPVALPIALSFDVSSAGNASQLISTMDDQIAACNSLAAYLGAVQTALASTASTLTNTGTNLSAARGRIDDTDYAEATAQFAHERILQTAGVAMLTQANAMPSEILRLLRA
ncbi:MAG: flagellin [Burkholderiaceae bacterium]|nr:flagellin [Burkholderiaceae bacterium]